MIGRFAPLFGVLMLVASILVPAPANAQYWQCVGYAREITGVAIRGNAHTWWGQAEKLYARGKAPKAGAILALKSAPGMPMGHVAVVSEIVSDREVLLTHANWSRGGAVERDVRAIDVSEAGDWSAVRIWYAPIGGLGTRTNPAFGFIYPESTPATFDAPVYAAAKTDRGPLVSSDVIQLAMLER